MKLPRRSILGFLTLLSVAGSWACTPTSTVAPGEVVYSQEMRFEPSPRLVLIVSFDGLRPDAIAPAKAAHLLALQQAGVTARKAYTIQPSITLPSHSSMLSGVDVGKHGILWNDWQPDRGTIRVPTVFDEAKKRGLKTAMVVGKEKFRHLAREGSVDRFVYDEGPADRIARATIEILREDRPQLVFVHFAHPDRAGHRRGWMSRAQFEAIREADRALGEIFRALRDFGLLASSAVIVTADHGGEGKGHGDTSEASSAIPWIAAGAGVADPDRDGKVNRTLRTYDTAATAAALLQIPVPKSWDGKPAFGAP